MVVSDLKGRAQLRDTQEARKRTEMIVFDIVDVDVDDVK